MTEPLQLYLYEEWKPIKGHEDYMISTYGRCYAKDRMIATKGGWSQFRGGRLLTPHNKSNGYYNYRIQGDSFYIHRLVALAFIPNPYNKPDVDHIDGNRANNHVENLRWATRSENMRNPVTYPKLSEVQIKRAVVMLDADGNYICEAKGVPVLSKMCGLPKHGIESCLSKKTVYCYGFRFISKEEYDPSKDYAVIAPQYNGVDYVINERAIVVFSCGKLYDVFPCANLACKHYRVDKQTLFRFIAKRIKEQTKDKFPLDCEIHLFKDIDDSMKEEVKKFYRNKYPIPNLLKKS